MGERLCPGLPADWLNAWLAAIGALVLVPELRLRWSDDPVPLAVLTSSHDDPANLIAERWPTDERVANLPIARHLDGHRELTLKPGLEAWDDRTDLARTSPDNWTLSSLFTDLAYDQRARAHTVERGQLHTPMPGRDNTMHDRIRKLLRPVSATDIGATLDGISIRRSNYGLGFDLTRITSLGDVSAQMVDPVIEILAFHGLALFPTRGDGNRKRQRGWPRRGELRWHVWDHDLSLHGVDAALDLFAAERRTSTVAKPKASWESVRYEPRGTNDATRGYGARRVHA